MIRILFLGDIFGRPGRQAVKAWLPGFVRERAVDFVIANVENAAGGKGTTPAIVDELARVGVHVFTGGNHSFAQREGYSMFENDERLLRPANLPQGVPGRGLGIYTLPTGIQIAVLNVQGRAFMRAFDCPFRTAEAAAEEALRETPLLIVDFHAEATSEKVGMTCFLDGKATAVIGTHTHIPTADARITPGGTAAITDAGMCGPYESVIGIESDIILDQMILGLPVRHQVATGDVRISGLLIDADERSGRAQACELIQHPAWPLRAQSASC